MKWSEGYKLANVCTNPISISKGNLDNKIHNQSNTSTCTIHLPFKYSPTQTCTFPKPFSSSYYKIVTPFLHTKMIKQKLEDVTLNPTRKSRTKTKKPKFLSLRLQLSPETPPISTNMSLNLFPLHPEVDRESNEENHVDYFFSGSDGGATSLTGILDENEAAMSPSSVTYAYDAQDGELERTALRNRERDDSEEVKWVCYSEVVERKDEEVSSCDADVKCYGGNHQSKLKRQLSLKLDYEEIINAWSDKGPLYINLDSPQTVPQLPHHFLDHDDHLHNGLWSVPEMSTGASNSSGSSIKLIKEEDFTLAEMKDNWKKIGQREASVLRYKEKRHNRLFAKKIRYQVRKLNAEKRPRIKGRFVKRS